MRIIVPLQGVVQGRGGLVLGSVIPCALFYFLQLYLRRNRSPGPAPPPPSGSSSSGELAELSRLPRSASRTHLSPRGSAGQVPVSARAAAVVRPADSPYYVGLKRAAADPYDAERNPGGVVQLGLAENKVSLGSYCCVLLCFLDFGRFECDCCGAVVFGSFGELVG